MNEMKKIEVSCDTDQFWDGEQFVYDLENHAMRKFIRPKAENPSVPLSATAFLAVKQTRHLLQQENGRRAELFHVVSAMILLFKEGGFDIKRLQFLVDSSYEKESLK
jgi:hypothetical protein